MSPAFFGASPAGADGDFFDNPEAGDDHAPGHSVGHARELDELARQEERRSRWPRFWQRGKPR
ncbi:MAG: hypothetical protein F4X65_00910 [Chloroflexi bacterium]|nr:hypothetical protein [Chloroflexota bacterium]